MSVSDLIVCIIIMTVFLMAGLGIVLGMRDQVIIANCEEKLILRSDWCEIVAVPVSAPAASGEE